MAYQISRDVAAATIAHVVAYDLVFSMSTDALAIADACNQTLSLTLAKSNLAKRAQAGLA